MTKQLHRPSLATPMYASDSAQTQSPTDYPPGGGPLDTRAVRRAEYFQGETKIQGARMRLYFY